jgi:hypothetical protein
MTEAVSTSESSDNLNETAQRNIPEGCDLHTGRHENMKSHFFKVKFLSSGRRARPQLSAVTFMLRQT